MELKSRPENVQVSIKIIIKTIRIAVKRIAIITITAIIAIIKANITAEIGVRKRRKQEKAFYKWKESFIEIERYEINIRQSKAIVAIKGSEI